MRSWSRTSHPDAPTVPGFRPPACIDLFGTNVPRFFHKCERQDFARFLDTGARRYFGVLEGDDILGCGGVSLGDEGRTASLC